MYKKVAFIVCPSQELERPPAAAAALAGVMVANNVEYKIYDLNLDLYNSIPNHDWELCERKWRIDSSIKLPESFYQWLDAVVNDITSDNYDLLALSVFTKFSSRFAEIFLKAIRPKINTTIIAGGQGLGTPWGNSTFGKFLKNNQGLVDHVAIGDGEIIFDRFLKGEKDIPGLDSIPPEQINDLDAIPYPNLDQLDPKNYKYHENPGIYITASRGCVRKCQFCDVPWRWPKYRYRQGQDIAKEMYLQYQKTNTAVFQFTDSVINGVIPQFEKLQDCIIEYKSVDSNFQPSWISQFNIRKKRDMPERIYKKMAAAGANVLICGVEHSSWHIREAMGKEFNDDDLDHHIKMCAKYGIKNVFLMFIGFPTETVEDHKHLLTWLEKYRVYMLAGTIMLLRWGYTGSLDYGSRLTMNVEELNIVPEWPNINITAANDHTQDWLYGRNWINLNNPTLTFRERIRRRLEAHEKSIQLGYPVTRGKEELEALKIICQLYLTDANNLITPIEEPGDH
jgi:hypothetical protein